MKKRIRRITPEIQDDIINMYVNHNNKIIEISKKYNLSHTAVYKVVNEYLGELSLGGISNTSELNSDKIE